MKVIINTYPCAFITPGGGEVQLMRTFEQLQDLNVDVSLYNSWKPALDEADIVHFFSVFGGSYYFCQMVKRLGKKLAISPVIWIDDPAKYPSAEIKAMLDVADIILPNSQLEAEMLTAAFGIDPAKFHVVHNAVEENAFESVDPTLFGRVYGLHDYFLCVGNIEDRKNQLRLLEAMKNMPYPLICIGHVRDEAYLQRCKEIGGAQFQYIGPLEHNSPLLLSAYAGAKLFVLPSTLETPGLAALEAAAAGCRRMLVTAVGSAREYFGDQVGYVEDPYDPEHIRMQIGLRLVDGEKDCRFVAKRFTWKRAAEQTLAAYEKLLGE